LESIGFAWDDVLKGVNGTPLVSIENFNRAMNDAIEGVESGKMSETKIDLKRGAYGRVAHTIKIE